VVNEHTHEDGAVVFLHACKLGFAGIVSKRLSAPYRSGVSRDWLKVKNPDSPAMRPLPLRSGRQIATVNSLCGTPQLSMYR
jgi:ATP-dependent DNA ligase